MDKVEPFDTADEERAGADACLPMRRYLLDTGHLLKKNGENGVSRHAGFQHPEAGMTTDST